jgi:hypothetical protein
LEVYVNMRKWGHHVLLAACDADLLGRVLREGKIVFEVREEFYKGPKMSVDKAIGLMRKSTVVNMVGNCIVQKAIETGLIHPEAVLNISGILHAQIVKM